MSLEILTAAVAAGETKSFMVNGQYLELIDAQYPVDVLMQTREGGMVSTLKGAEVSFYSRPSKAFGQVQITSAQAQIVRFFIGDGDAGTRRISSVVQVVDGEKARTLAGGMFTAAPGCTADAGKFPAVQVWNPKGSGKRVIVGQVSMTTNVGQAVNVLFENAAQGTDVSVLRLANKLGAATAGAAQARSAGTGLAGPSSYSIWGAFIQTNGFVNWSVRGAIVLPPGSGLTVAGSVAASALGANFEWFEEAI